MAIALGKSMASEDQVPQFCRYGPEGSTVELCIGAGDGKHSWLTWDGWFLHTGCGCLDFRGTPGSCCCTHHMAKNWTWNPTWNLIS